MNTEQDAILFAKNELKRFGLEDRVSVKFDKDHDTNSYNYSSRRIILVPHLLLFKKIVRNGIILHEIIHADQLGNTSLQIKKYFIFCKNIFDRSLGLYFIMFVLSIFHKEVLFVNAIIFVLSLQHLYIEFDANIRSYNINKIGASPYDKKLIRKYLSLAFLTYVITFTQGLSLCIFSLTDITIYSHLIILCVTIIVLELYHNYVRKKVSSCKEFFK